MSWEILYYEDQTGHESVAAEIAEFPKKAQAKVLRFIDLLEQEGPVMIGGGYVRHVEGDIRELRIDFANDRFRILYFVVLDRTIVLLRAFEKKTQRTPRSEIATAARRLDDFMRRTGQG
jgi:phage-related protein